MFAENCASVTITGGSGDWAGYGITRNFCALFHRSGVIIIYEIGDDAGLKPSPVSVHKDKILRKQLVPRPEPSPEEVEHIERDIKERRASHQRRKEAESSGQI